MSELLKYFTIFNTIISISFIIFIIYKYPLFYIEIHRTFWCKKSYAISIMRYVYKGKHSYYSKALLTITFKDQKKLEEWDREMFYNGRYKK